MPTVALQPLSEAVAAGHWVWQILGPGLFLSHVANARVLLEQCIRGPTGFPLPLPLLQKSPKP